jgi:alkylmercury lyase
MPSPAGTGSADLGRMARALAGTFPGREDSGRAIALLRALALGRPVSVTALASVVSRDAANGAATLARWPNVEWDSKGDIVAFGGLTLRATAHQFVVDGRQLHCWCAWDTLFLPALLGQPAHVRSRCPMTGAAVALTVNPDGVSAAAPASLAVSFPPLDAMRTDDIVGTFCCHVHFLAGPDAADRWLADHRGAAVLALDDAFELGRLANGSQAHSPS